MKDITNLAWPNEPFGVGHHRPWGRTSKTLCAIQVQLADALPGSVGCVASVYLRIDREPLQVASATLPVGFRVTIAEDPTETLELIDTSTPPWPGPGATQPSLRATRSPTASSPSWRPGRGQVSPPSSVPGPTGPAANEDSRTSSTPPTASPPAISISVTSTRRSMSAPPAPRQS